MGYLASRLRERHGSWLDFVRGEQGVTAGEERVFETAGGFLRDLETTEMTKCFKMVTLEGLLEAGQLVTGMAVDELAVKAHALLRRSPELFADVPDELREHELDDLRRVKWIAYWKKNPIAAWAGNRREGRTWFATERDRFRLELGIEASDEGPLQKLTRELVDYRLTQYRDRKRQTQPTSEGFICKVLSNQRDPILKLPPRSTGAVPEGEVDVGMADGAVWQFRFMKELCNVARRAGQSRNELPDLLRGWFGPRAGQPGTAFQVRFHASPDGLWVEPVQAAVIDLASRRKIVAYPDLRAAAGHAAASVEPPDDELVALPIEDGSPELFAVRVSEPDGRRARVLGAAQRGGLRVDGGEGGFKERTVSLNDLAWVVASADDVADHGGLLDEERVNKLRYLDGTPKGSTPWIDTGWAIAAWNVAKSLIRDPVAVSAVTRRVHRDDGKQLDASFRVERVGDAQTIVFESRGGTRGSADERNVDYAEGLELLLQRLKRAGLALADVLVESRDTEKLPAADRRVVLEDAPYPVIIEDVEAIRRKLSAAQAKVRRAKGARGAGNRTRRLRLFVQGGSDSIAELAAMLERSGPG
jgi:hypothetical protein